MTHDFMNVNKHHLQTPPPKKKKKKTKKKKKKFKKKFLKLKEFKEGLIVLVKKC